MPFALQLCASESGNEGKLAKEFFCGEQDPQCAVFAWCPVNGTAGSPPGMMGDNWSSPGCAVALPALPAQHVLISGMSCCQVSLVVLAPSWAPCMPPATYFVCRCYDDPTPAVPGQCNLWSQKDNPRFRVLSGAAQHPPARPPACL